MVLVDQVREDEWVDRERYRVDGHGELFGRILYRNQVYWISEGRWDFFISHASTDKDGVAWLTRCAISVNASGMTNSRSGLATI
jgi:hypothetical protein